MASNSKHYVLGIDIGTSGTKSLLVSESGAIVAQASASYPLLSPQPGWNEQNPSDWWRAVKKTIRKIVQENPKRNIVGIGLSGQMHGSVFLDKKASPIRPALLWNDQRTQSQCDFITQKAGGAKALLKTANNLALTGYTAPKILWLKENEPEAFKKLHQVLLPKDYINYKLTGVLATDVGDASGTLLFDVKSRRWNTQLIETIGLDLALFPTAFESSEVIGTLSPRIASKLGLSAHIPVVAGSGDQPAGAVGMGVVSPGTASATIGTSGVVFAASDAPVDNPGGVLQSFCHAVPDKWAVFGCMLSAGGALEWLRGSLYADTPSKNIFKKMMKEANLATPGSDGLFFLPYLEGERCPHPDPNSRACWVGLNSHHKRPALTRATVEGITFGMKDQIELMNSIGITIKEIRCAGGGTKSKFWRQLLANCYNSKIIPMETVDASAFGAALLSGVGSGIWKSVPSACKQAIQLKPKVIPHKKEAAFYEKRHQVFQSLYPKLKTSFAALQAS